MPAARGYTSFFHDVLIRNERDPGVHYRVYSYEGWYAYISSLENYYACSMKLLTQEARDGLFGVRNRPVLTKVRNSPPTRYSAGSDVNQFRYRRRLRHRGQGGELHSLPRCPHRARRRHPEQYPHAEYLRRLGRPA